MSVSTPHDSDSLRHHNNNTFHSDDLVYKPQHAKTQQPHHHSFAEFQDHEDDTNFANSSRRRSSDTLQTNSNRLCSFCTNCAGDIDAWCTNHHEHFWRIIKHCWFFVLLAISFLWTSFPRIIVMFDVVVTASIFLKCPSSPGLNFDQIAFDVLVIIHLHSLALLFSTL
jgi:hypothetical protein